MQVMINGVEAAWKGTLKKTEEYQPPSPITYYLDKDGQELGYLVRGTGLNRDTRGRPWSEEMKDKYDWVRIDEEIDDEED